MKTETKPSNLDDKLMNFNKNDLPKDMKIDAVEKNDVNTKKADKPLLKNTEIDNKQVEKLSAKEQENRLKFKEKLNKLKKMPMPSEPIINVNSEGLTESDLSIENMKRKFKEILSKFLKESAVDFEKPDEKKPANDIKVSVRTNKPLDSALYRFACTLPFKKNDPTGKDIDSIICKSVDLLHEQHNNNEQTILASKVKQKIENEKPVDLSPVKKKEKTEPLNKSIKEKILGEKKNEKPLKESAVEDKKPVKNAKEPTDMDLLKPENVSKRSEQKVLARKEVEKLNEPINNVRGGILSSILKTFTFDSKLFQPNLWFSSKNKNAKMKTMRSSLVSRISLRWRHGFVILGTFIPLYYTYHKIVTNRKLSTMRIEEN